MKKTLITPYFGTFPNYFDLFLESCRHNPSFTFLIFTDQTVSAPFPENVSLYAMSFGEMRELAGKKSGFAPDSPYKLCDFKPAYGLIFEEYLREADFWGYVDVDLILGDLSEFLDESIFRQYDKILTHGHLSLHRNTPKMNRMFQAPLKSGFLFKQSVSFTEPCYFDETFFNRICLERGVRIYQDGRYADILPQYDGFIMANFGEGLENLPDQTFVWNQGRLARIGNQGQEQELIYIHLQKRPMKISYGAGDFGGAIHVTPQGLVADRDYDASFEVPMKGQGFAFQRGRFRKLSPRKLWIKYHVKRTMCYLQKHGIHV